MKRQKTPLGLLMLKADVGSLRTLSNVRQRDKDKERQDSLFSSWFQCDISDGLALPVLLAQNNQALLIYFRLTSLVALKID